MDTHTKRVCVCPRGGDPKPTVLQSFIIRAVNHAQPLPGAKPDKQTGQQVNYTLCFSGGYAISDSLGLVVPAFLKDSSEASVTVVGISLLQKRSPAYLPWRYTHKITPSTSSMENKAQMSALTTSVQQCARQQPIRQCL